jgi:hypothetical protein
MAMRSTSEIQTDLDNAIAARTKLLTRGVSEGFDGASVSRVSLADLNDLIRSLQTELGYAGGTIALSSTPTIGIGT